MSAVFVHFYQTYVHHHLFNLLCGCKTVGRHCWNFLFLVTTQEYPRDIACLINLTDEYPDGDLKCSKKKKQSLMQL